MKDLKTIYLTIIMLFSFGILLFILYYDNNTVYDVVYVDSIDNNSTNSIELFVLDENENITSTLIYCEDLSYESVLEFYNVKMNSIDVAFISPFIIYTEIRNFKIENNNLFIEVDALSKDVSVDKLMKCLIKTFSFFDIHNVYLKAGKSTFNISINDVKL